ncbi:GNAT family N-acetyltransferase, partial [Hymenobacter sp. UV11]
WEALVKEEGGRYVAGLPLPVRRKFGLRYLQQPPFAQQLGLFYAPSTPPTSADWAKIGELLHQHFWVITQYAFNTGNTELLGVGQPGLTGVAFTTYHLPMQPAYSQLLAGYKPNRRWRLNQARRRGLRIEPSNDIDQLVRLFAENTAPKIYGLIGEDYEYRMLRDLYAQAEKAGMAELWQARSSADYVIAMILLFKFNRKIIYLFSGASAAGKAAGAISVLLDETFRKYATHDMCFDFEVHDVPGLIEFYSSFGSKKAPFLTITADRLPWPVRQLKAARVALYRRLRPRPAANGA